MIKVGYKSSQVGWFTAEAHIPVRTNQEKRISRYAGSGMDANREIGNRKVSTEHPGRRRG